MTRKELQTRTRKELVILAKRYGVQGWHPMKKAELVSAITKAVRKAERQGRGKNNLSPFPAPTNGRRSPDRRAPNVARLRKTAPVAREKDLATRAKKTVDDTLVAEVFELNWLRASWHLSPKAIDRAAVALGAEWHQARPIIRVQHLEDDVDGSGVETVESDVSITGDSDVWFVRVQHPEGNYRLQIGYITPKGRFFALARSKPMNPMNSVTGDSASIHAEERRSSVFRRPEDSGILQRGPANGDGSQAQQFDLNLETELVVRGKTHPASSVTLLGESISVATDGVFQVTCPLNDGREVLPAVAVSPDGAEQRTVILGIEQNTKSLEPLVYGEQ